MDAPPGGGPSRTGFAGAREVRESAVMPPTPEAERSHWPSFYRDPAKAASYEERRTRSWWRRLSWRRELALARALVASTRAVEASEPGARVAARWLDLACGPGRTLAAVPRGAVAVDLSFAMLE